MGGREQILKSGKVGVFQKKRSLKNHLRRWKSGKVCLVRNALCGEKTIRRGKCKNPERGGDSGPQRGGKNVAMDVAEVTVGETRGSECQKRVWIKEEKKKRGEGKKIKIKGKKHREGRGGGKRRSPRKRATWR